MASSPPDEAFLPCEPWWACSGTELGFNGTARCSGEGRTGFRCEAIKTSHRSFGKRLLECVPERHSLLGGRLLWTVGPSVIILGFWGLSDEKSPGVAKRGANGCGAAAPGRDPAAVSAFIRTFMPPSASPSMWRWTSGAPRAAKASFAEFHVPVSIALALSFSINRKQGILFSHL